MVYPIIYKVLYILAGAGFLPSKVFFNKYPPIFGVGRSVIPSSVLAAPSILLVMLSICTLTPFTSFTYSAKRLVNLVRNSEKFLDVFFSTSTLTPKTPDFDPCSCR